MKNIGIAPPDFDTPVGMFRAEINDTEYTELDPAVPGFGAYEDMGDVEIEALLNQADGNIDRAVGRYYLRLAELASMQAKVVKDHDLSLDLTKRAAELRESASARFALADEADAQAGIADEYLVYSPGEARRYRHPEASPWEVFGA